MGLVHGILGQEAPAAATLTTIYTVTTGSEAVNSSCIVCNRSATPTAFRIAVSPLGAAILDEHYIFYDRPIGPNDTFAFTLGLTLASTDIFRVYATLATLSFTLGGMEIAP